MSSMVECDIGLVDSESLDSNPVEHCKAEDVFAVSASR